MRALAELPKPEITSGLIRRGWSALASPSRAVFRTWRRNLPAAWWVSPACAFLAGFYIVAVRVLFVGFA